MMVKRDGVGQWFTLVNWDFNDPVEAPVLFVDADGNKCQGRIELDWDTWEAGPDGS